MKKLLTILLSLSVLFCTISNKYIVVEAESSSYYVDLENGNDTTGDGTQSNKYKTVEKALDVANTNGGDYIYVTGKWAISASSDSANLNLNGNTVIFDYYNQQNAAITTSSTGDYDVSIYNGTMIFENADIALLNTGKLKISDVTIKMNKTNTSIIALFNYNGNANIENCDFDLSDSNTNEKVDFLNSGNLVVNGGRYKNSIINNVPNGFVVKAGTFNIDVSSYVTSPYVCTNNGDGTYTITCEITSNEELGEWFSSQVEKAVLKNDITSTGQKVLLNNSNFHINKTLDLKNYTITNGANSESVFYNQYANVVVTIKNGILDGGYDSNLQDDQRLKNNLIYVCRGKLILDGVKIKNCGNYAIYLGSSCDGVSEILNSSFTDCINDGGSVAAISSDTDIKIKNSTFKNCRANDSSANGGAIYVSNDNTCIIEDSKFENCFSNYRGGAIYHIGESSIEINNVNFINCSSTQSAGAVYIQNDGHIKNSKFEKCSSKYGGVIDHYSADDSYTLSIDDSTFTDCFADNSGGVIYHNKGKLELNRNTIKGCRANNFGGAISNIQASAELNGNIIEDCYTYNCGGAINNYQATLVLNGNTIKDCVTNNCGGGIFNEGTGTSLTLNGDTIKDCDAPFGSGIYINQTPLTLDGSITIDNINNKGIKEDIYVDDSSDITVKSNYSSNKKIGICVNYNKFSNYVYNGVVKNNGYTGSLMDLFACSEIYQYLTVDNSSLNMNYVNSFYLVEPTKTNFFTTEIGNVNDSTLEITYQWYKTGYGQKVQIGGTGDYDLGLEEFNLSDYNGTYNGNNTWTMSKSIDNNNSYMFKFSGLKAGQVLTFDFQSETGTEETYINLADSNGNQYGVVDAYDTVLGKFEVPIPFDGDFWIWAGAWDNDGNKRDVTISNIYIENGNAEKLVGETNATLSHPEANTYTYVIANLKNKVTGAKKSFGSSILTFGDAISGDKQSILKGTKEKVEIVLDTNNPDVTYKNISDMKVYVNGNVTELDKSNYTLSDPQQDGKTLKLTLKDSYIKNLAKGKYTYFVYVSDTDKKEYIAANLNIYEEEKIVPTTCEYVIGPRWHWNDAKGVCELEDYSVINTATK